MARSSIARIRGRLKEVGPGRLAVGGSAGLILAGFLLGRLYLGIELPTTGLATLAPGAGDRYQAGLARLQAGRAALSSRYAAAARTETEREHVLEEARSTFLEAVRADIFPYWYGTPWDFGGTTETPRGGGIACGYFVSTVLRDAGLRVERVRLAQQASENIIRSLTGPDHIRRFSDVPIDRFVETVQQWGDGLYVVGLDIHVGFLDVARGSVWFVHSSYQLPYCVVREQASRSRILSSSRYRVVGKISDDAALLRKWLGSESFATHNEP